MKQKPPSIVPVLVLTLLTTVTWVFFSVYRALTSKPTAVVTDEISKPLDPTFDKAATDKINARLFLDDSQIPTTTFTSPLVGTLPSPTPSATTTATPTPQPQSTTTATESGALTP